MISVSWSPDGSKIASGSDDSTVRVWDSSTGAVLSTLEGHSGAMTSVSWSPDGSKIASGSDDKTVRV
jgi:WD40 repeat protein